MKRHLGMLFGGFPPERVDDLSLDITARGNQLHFYVDAAWPPHGHAPEARVLVPKQVRERRKPYVFKPGHVLAAWCVTCGAAPGKMCREIDPENEWFNRPRRTHWERGSMVHLQLEIQRLERELEAMK